MKRFLPIGLASILAVPAGFASAADSAGAAPACTAAPYRQLDYWIGDWDVHESDAPQGAVIAHARVEPVAGGCALFEHYEQLDGLIGDSLLGYDAVRRQWRQTWSTNRGSVLVIDGALDGATLVLEGEMHAADGRTFRQRISWQKQGEAVREWALLSKDGGATWSPAFDVVFRKRSAPRER